jgi:hypothetical protein
VYKIKTNWKQIADIKDITVNTEVFTGNLFQEALTKEQAFFDNVNNFVIVERRIIHEID